ncbi:hypothetical protein H6781_02385 [Candidatus Nomurabacteria bacterium]|nr:hypothetical protein [Candidatus Kaiserbacteria bacterium]MCB9810420.1 hypothetical protein [Candidatus Nomurabacteria bacterium]MCB9817997.1 hypothetical protein [Candidatus Nomurabacteria bacterium]
MTDTPVYDAIMKNRSYLNEHGCLPPEKKEKTEAKIPTPRRDEVNRGLSRRPPTSCIRR